LCCLCTNNNRGSPTRYDGTTQWMDGVTFERLREGHFERAISLHRTIYSYVTQSRSWLPDAIGARLWFAPHQPHTSAYVPFYVGGGMSFTYTSLL
jgi:dipeptidase